MLLKAMIVFRVQDCIYRFHFELHDNDVLFRQF